MFIRLFSVLLSIMLFCTGCGVSKENSKSDVVENKEPTVDDKVEKIVNPLLTLAPVNSFGATTLGFSKLL